MAGDERPGLPRYATLALLDGYYRVANLPAAALLKT